MGVGPGLCGLPGIHLLKLSEKGCEHPSNPEFGRYTEDEMAEKPLLGGPQGYAVGASEAFRTVSLGRWVNKGKRKGRGVEASALGQ